MRIVIDLQGAQGPSRNRGIGRYSIALAKAMIAHGGGHEYLVALNAAVGGVDELRDEFAELLPRENVRAWFPPRGPMNAVRMKCAELTREAFLASLKPDVVHVSSLFERVNDVPDITVGTFSSSVPTVVTLFDLIPLIYPDRYLVAPGARQWYMARIDSLRRADLLLGISGSACREAVEYLGVPEEKVVNISSAADDQFTRMDVLPRVEEDLRRRLGLPRPFLMYTGGIDYRKNIEGLIRAFAALPDSLRRSRQLAVVCSVSDESRRELQKLARDHGLGPEDFVLTGYVSDADLVVLYNLCELFVFPSWHEGFGLPVLEAMHCGAPVIAADSSSLPEVVGRSDALFAPHSDEAISQKIVEVLTDDAFRADLAAFGPGQARRFSWEKSAAVAIEALEKHFGSAKNAKMAPAPRRPRLAFVSPLPPERSGIADYSAELLPELARFYEIDVVSDQESISDAGVLACCTPRSVEWFVRNHRHYERVLYQVGNSHFHLHMFDLLQTIPGAIVLHDFFLSGAYGHRAARAGLPGLLALELYRSHGYQALVDAAAPRNYENTIYKYPCNYDILEAATGVIVHSNYSKVLARHWYGEEAANDWELIPLLRVAGDRTGHDAAKCELGLADDTFLVCSFGYVASTKQSQRVLDAWLQSSMARDPRCRLVFVGDTDGGPYSTRMMEAIRNSGSAGRVSVSGWTDQARFRTYLAAADVAVQLRTLSRGETSAAVLDCMNYGVATIVNANGSMADLDAQGVLMMPDEFSDQQLVDALESLYTNAELRQSLGNRAREIIATRHAPRTCAEQYHLAIERFHATAEVGKLGLVEQVSNSLRVGSSADAFAVAESIAWTMPPKPSKRQWLVDVSAHRDATAVQPNWARLRDLLQATPEGFRLEPVHLDEERGGFCYSRSFTLDVLGIPKDMLQDDLVDIAPGDIFITSQAASDAPSVRAEVLRTVAERGAHVEVRDACWLDAPTTAGPAMHSSSDGSVVALTA